MNLFIPHYKDRFRLVNPLPINSPYISRLMGGEKDIPAGTVIAIERVTINKATNSHTTAWVRILASPDKRIAMKKYGGDASCGCAFNRTIDELRQIEVELVEGMD